MKQLIVLFVLVLAGFIYLTTLHGVWGNLNVQTLQHLDYQTSPFESSHERAPYALTISLLQNHSFALSQDLADIGTPDVGYTEGKYYIFFPPGISVLILPFFKLGELFNLQQVFSYAVIPIFAIFSILLIYKISKNIYNQPAHIALAAGLTYAFASTSWSYAVTIYQHVISTFLILLLYYAVWKYKQNARFSWIWATIAWFSYGVSPFIDYPNLILMLPIMFYFFLCTFKIKRVNKGYEFSFRKIFLVTAIAFVFVGGIHAYYNHVNFGNWKTFSNTFARYEKEKKNDLVAIEAGKKALLSQDSTLISATYKEDKTLKGLYTLLFSIDRGLFVYSPVFLLALAGIFLSVRKFKLEITILLATILMNVISYASFGDPWGGWAFGPRYLIPSMALLAIFVGQYLSISKHKVIAYGLFGILFSYSVAIALTGALTTNVVPPKIEADYLKLPYYNFLQNIKFLLDGKSASFIYNFFVSKYLTLFEFASCIYLFILGGTCALLFNSPDQIDEIND